MFFLFRNTLKKYFLKKLFLISVYQNDPIASSQLRKCESVVEISFQNDFYLEMH